jgi:AcrR family transcriptional regulator
MVIKQRAILGEDKESRRDDILAAAERLMLADSSRLPSVDEVARTAGLAKGTVYLYFTSKEELLLAIHARNATAFFTDLNACLGGDTQVALTDMLEVLRRHLVVNEGYLPLAVRCFAVMDKDLPIEAVVATKLGVSAWLSRSATGVVRHFPTLSHDDALNLLMQSYALALGMWQLLHPVERMNESMRAIPELQCFTRPFWPELSRAIISLWQQRLFEASRGVAASSPSLIV